MRQARHLLPWAVWGAAVLAYAIAVINRSSLSALGPAAQDHFGIDATTLSIFPVVQLLVYAGLQIPVGTLLDRFGPTVLILVGGALMLIGQVAMATVSEVWLAILARIFVGAGDACTFISVIRMLPDWFALRQLPTLSQVTGLIGQAGQLVSVTPLALAVGAFGWTTGFLGVSAVTLLVTLLGVVVLRDRPGAGTLLERLTGRLGATSRNARSLAGHERTGTVPMAPPSTEMIPTVQPPRFRALGFWASARRLLGIPGVRLAYWLHFTSPFALNAFVLLWGTPFLTGGVGLDRATAGGLLSLMIVSSMTAGLVLGPVTSRFLERRVWIYIALTSCVALAWIAVIAWPGTPPLWLLVILMIVMPIGGPASMMAFEVARSHTPRSFSGFGTGLVNTGGFTSGLLVILLIGLLLDVQGAGSPENYSLGAFKAAFAVQIPFWVIGLTMVLVEMRRTKRWMEKHGRRLR